MQQMIHSALVNSLLIITTYNLSITDVEFRCQKRCSRNTVLKKNISKINNLSCTYI